MGISTYADFQALESSEKIALIKVEASRRLMGWTVQAGNVYKLTSFDHAVITDLLEDGTSLTEVSSLASVSAGKYFNDRDNQILYLETTGSDHPNGYFIAVTFENYFSNVGGIHQPNDLATGFDVHWLPYVEATSQFGVKLDNQEFLGFALEGGGTITFINDRDYWSSRYDKWFWENQKIRVYSWNRALAITEAKLIFRGLVQGRDWTDKQVKFKLKDQLKVLREPIPLDNLEDASGAVVIPSLATAKQRLLYGRVKGMVPSNIDQVLPLGNTITGTASTTNGSASVTGSGTSFLAEVSPNDNLVFGSDTTEYTVLSITNDTTLTLSENYGGSTAAGKAVKIKPSHPKRYQNRVFLVAGHALKEPATTVSSAYNTTKFVVASDTDFFVGAEIKVDGEITTITRVANNIIEVSPSLSVTPSASDTVVLSSVWNVYLGSDLLELDTHYTFSAADGTLTLETDCELNVAKPQGIIGTASFTTGSRTVTGSGTLFEDQLSPGDWIKDDSESVWYEVLSVESNTSLTIRVVSAYTKNTGTQRKRPKVYQEGETTLSCDAMGATANGVKTGDFMGTGALAVKDILTRIGLAADINATTFTSASADASQIISLAIPEEWRKTKADKARDVINLVNESIFGSVYQDEDFKLNYGIINPGRTTSFTKFIEAEVIKWKVKSDASKLVKTVVIEYLNKEFDREALEPSFLEYTHTSEIAEYLGKTDNEFRLSTVLQTEADAKVFAQRWAFIREIVATVITIETSLKASQLSVHDRVKLAHEKLYQRFGSTLSEKLAGITAVNRDFSGSKIEIDDLGNAYNRAATITANTANVWDDASNEEKLVNGFITDNYGMIDNDPETFGLNVIW